MQPTGLDGRTIKIGRTLKGLSQRELGEMCGMRPWRIWALENRVYEPRPDEVIKIWKVLST
jgi:transcriptional regulator with XRE-family HTH domain